MTTTRHLITWGWSAAAAATVAACLGCENADARRRDEIQRVVNKAVIDLRKQTIDGLDPANDAARTKLEGLATQLAAINDGAPGQQAAAALLAADAHAALGQMALARAHQVESADDMDRLVAHSVIGVAARVDAILRGQEAISDTDGRAQLDRHQEVATQQLSAAGDSMARVDGPMATINKQNSADAAKIASLKQQSDQLYSQASQEGRVAGLDDFIKATELRREYQQLQRRVGEREVELAYKYEPDAALARAHAAFQKDVLDQIAKARQDLDALGQQNAAQIEAMKAQLGRFRESIDKLLSAINGRDSGELKERYDAATTHFEQAATLADKAASRGDRSASGPARLAAVAARQSLGEAQASRARGLAEQVGLLERLQAVGEAVAPAQKVAAEREKALAARKEALDQAQQALTAAGESLGQVTSRGNEQQVEVLKVSIQRSIAGLSGQPAPPLPAPAGAPAAAAATPEADADPSPGGFASPEELLGFLKSVKPTDADAGRRLLRAMRAKTATGRQMLAMLKSMMEGSIELNRAIADKFGEEALESLNAAAGMSGGLPNFRQAELASTSGDTATMRVRSPAGGVQDIQLARIGGSWYMQVDSMSGGAAAPTGAEGQAAAAMMERMGAVMRGVFTSMASRVSAGEFDSPEAVMQALQTEMMQKMAQGAAPAAGRQRPPGGAEPDK